MKFAKALQSAWYSFTSSSVSQLSCHLQDKCFTIIQSLETLPNLDKISETLIMEWNEEGNISCENCRKNIQKLNSIIQKKDKEAVYEITFGCILLTIILTSIGIYFIVILSGKISHGNDIIKNLTTSSLNFWKGTNNKK